MSDPLAPRGPDAQGSYAQGRVAFAHRRLRIIDLSEHAQQPMVDPALGLAIVFNGCIYNYKHLRLELEALGYRFYSHGDTETLLKAWHAWGPDCLAKLHGMFAFAIHERDSGRVILGRDRFGIKPLYLSRQGQRLRFASTLPALLAGGEVDTAIDPVALHHYLSWHAVVPPPRTILAGVQKLPPATLRVIDADGTEHDTQYWSLKVDTDPQIAALPAQERYDLVHNALRKAVSRRMVADVPVGVLLSGGVDSSLIVGLLDEAGQHGLETFSIGFEAAGGEKGDEFEYSDLVAQRFGTRHHKIPIPTSELMATLPDAIRAMSEPMVSYDNIGFFLLSRAVSQHLKVVQSGQGADEVFGGYHWYPPMAESRDPVGDYARVFFDRDHREMAEVLSPALLGEDYSRQFVANLFAEAHGRNALDKALHIDTTVMLVDDPVKRVDSQTMAWGLEARVPFLDHELVELAGKLPPEDKIGDGGKAVLKAIARQVVPREVVDRPKGYFPVPILKHLSGPTLNLVQEALNSPAARQRGIFRQPYVDRLLADPSSHMTPLRGSKLWQLGLLELWLQAHGV